MSILPVPDSQQEEFIRLQLAVDAIADLGDSRDLSIYESLEPSDLFGAGPNDEYLGFGMTWWRYLTSGASQFIPAGATRSRHEAHATRRCPWARAFTVCHASCCTCLNSTMPSSTRPLAA